ncbi:hypothetical protein FISHEDRAFT_73848 [Fistulina hepatica ATCC 64428]|uniref:Uncharacterized protein n=1 Tax=Fistulina hepatica ATCC 64428 TaxID=1128425 RepID=A0A0D7ACY6_9AGAR|nr:hypothetical protein FISHEDRAFT_73848 [Fistulina hepatica ATCC 64428]
MQLASYGLRPPAIRGPGIMSRALGCAVRATRSIHTVPHPPVSSGSFLERARIVLNRFVGHLTAPGIGVHTARHGLHSQAYSAAQSTRAHHIYSKLSLPARNAVHSDMAYRNVQRHAFLPRAPPAPPCTVAHVGLGMARNFSTARPIFQNLVENVPVVARSFCEVDLDAKSTKPKRRVANKQKEDKVKSLRPKAPRVALQKMDVASAMHGPEMEHCFPAPVVPQVTTQLLVPLQATPSGRVPLPAFTPERPLLVPLPEMAAIMDQHELHRLRIASLWDRLDAGRVWDRGATCSTYSYMQHGVQSACTVLEIEFTGWTMAQVRSVIGESGTGWCVLEELDRRDEVDALSDALSLDSPPIDPAQSFVLPTLDFSSPFVARSTASLTASSEAAHVTDNESDVGDWLSSSDGSEWLSDASSGVWVDPPSENGYFDGPRPAPYGLVLSADFDRRRGAEVSR